MVSVAHAKVVRFGVFEVDLRARELRRKGGRIRLQEQPFQVLTLLLERAGDVVTREELRQKLWPSSVYVDFDHGLNNAIARLREALGDAAATPHFIETMPRLGYRFIYPCTDAPLEPDTASDSRSERPRLARSIGWAVGALALVALLVALSLTQRSVDAVATGAPVLPKQPSIAVLPFVNMSSDTENEHFADGLSEELINKLAGIPGLKVAGQTSSFYFKGKNERTEVIARMLKVDHILEGSVRRSGASMRITVQLLDAADGYHRWSQTFDRDITDIFQVQEDIARNVAVALQVKLLGVDEQRLRKHGTRSPEAYQKYLVARAHISWVFGGVDWDTVKRSYEEAIALDPGFAAAYAGLADYYYNRAVSSLTNVEDGARLGLEAADRAMALDPECSEALVARANFEFWRYRFQGDFKAYERAHTDFRRALELNPSNASALFHYARAVQWSEPALALSLFDRTTELDPMRFSAVGLGALIMSRQGHDDAARKRIQDLYDRNPGKESHNAINVAALASYQGRLDEAVVFMREALPRGEFGSKLQLWGLYMSLGDRAAARDVLNSSKTALAAALGEAAGFIEAGHPDQAFKSLDAHRAAFPLSRVLDLPAARLALIAGESARAMQILEQRLPDLMSGAEPINARNVLPALDLADAEEKTGAHAQARFLLDRIAAFLDGPDAPRLPAFLYIRARAHALAGEPELAQQALDRAYDAGFRTTWALDLSPQPLLYIDRLEVDPAFETLRTSSRYRQWFARVEADNASQLIRLRARDAAEPVRS